MSGPRRDGEQVLAAYRRHISLGRARLAEMSGGVLEVSSNGSRVIDGQGDEYLDCGGYGLSLIHI